MLLFFSARGVGGGGIRGSGVRDGSVTQNLRCRWCVSGEGRSRDGDGVVGPQL